MPKTGKVTRVWSKPSRGFKLTVPPDPPEPETVYTFIGVDADDWELAVMARATGKDAEVDGTAPTCTGVTV